MAGPLSNYSLRSVNSKENESQNISGPSLDLKYKNGTKDKGGESQLYLKRS
jgi:hypothetical protein